MNFTDFSKFHHYYSVILLYRTRIVVDETGYVSLNMNLLLPIRITISSVIISEGFKYYNRILLIFRILLVQSGC